MKLALTAIATTAFATLAFASIAPDLSEAGWQHLTFDDKSPNAYSMSDEGGIVVEGQSSVSVLWRPIDQTTAPATHLSWRWRVDAAPPLTDLTRKGGDDRPISIYVSFEFDPERSSFWERSKRALVQPFVEDELPGRVLLYVWGGENAGDNWIESPYFSGIGKMKILRAGDSQLATWFEQQVDLIADHKEAFGEAPTRAYQIAISSDGDDTKSRIIAEIADLRLDGGPLP